MKQVTLYTTTYCPYCHRAKELLRRLGIAFSEVNVEDAPEVRDQLIEKYQWQTVPIILIGDECIGGSDELSALASTGTLLKKIHQG